MGLLLAGTAAAAFAAPAAPAGGRAPGPVAAAAAGHAVHAELAPATPGAHATLTLRAGPFPPAGGLPTALTLILQKGFTTATRHGAAAAAPLCSAVAEQQSLCPAATSIGTGSETVTLNPDPAEVSGTVTLDLYLYLGVARRKGCAASVDILVYLDREDNDATLPWAPISGIGDLCAHRGGLELSTTDLPSYQPETPNTAVTVHTLNLVLGPARGLLINPTTCSAHTKRTWTGTFAYGQTITSSRATLTFPCT